ncbi:MAG: DUF6431 domain-containing protein [Acidimicrobiales bacterium]
MAIVWPCSLSVDEYRAAGDDAEVPRPVCPACSKSMMFWSRYTRSVRIDGQCHRVRLRRARCGPCAKSHVLVPSFSAVGRLDVIDTIGEVITAVVVGGAGVRPVATTFDIPHTTARDWARRFRRLAERLAATFAALVVELTGLAPHPPVDPQMASLWLMDAAWTEACRRLGERVGRRWPFVNLVCGGAMLAATTNPLSTIAGIRRFMAPVP